MIRRDRALRMLRGLLRHHRVVGVLGARQVGKTTLARALTKQWEGPRTYYDLEDSEDLRLFEEPMLTLRAQRGLVVIDEVQRRADLFPLLRALADEPRTGRRFLLLGSASPDLLRQSSESLAGRIVYTTLPGLSLEEVGVPALARLWLRGGFPRSYLAANDSRSVEWRRSFVKTFVERDLPQFGVRVPSTTMERFWAMLAHVHAQTWNGAELARAFGVSELSVRRYLDLLASTFVVRLLRPWHENLAKRQVKSPKVYIADTGLLHVLLGIRTSLDLDRHPKVGASWEGFALSAVASRLGAEPDECYYWGTHNGAELDLLVVRGSRRLGFEFKRTEQPRVTPSMRIALADLRLDRLEVIHAGSHSFPLDERIEAVALSDLWSRPYRL